MKIKKNDFVNFLKKIKLDGAETVNEAIFNFSEEGLEINAITGANTVIVNAVLFKNVFTDYQPIGQIGIQDISKIISVIDTFNDIINVEVNTNLLSINEGNRKLETELVDVSFLPEAKKIKEFEYTESVNIQSTDIKSFFNRVLLNDDYKITLSTSMLGLVLSNTGKFKFTQLYDNKQFQQQVKVTFGVPIVSALKNLTDELVINCKTDFPILVTEKTDKSLINIMVAPNVEN